MLELKKAFKKIKKNKNKSVGQIHTFLKVWIKGCTFWKNPHFLFFFEGFHSNTWKMLSINDLRQAPAHTHGFVHGFVNFEKGGPIPIHVGSYIVNPCNFLPSRIQNMKINVKSMSEYLQR